jgi:hypothetical protein
MHTRRWTQIVKFLTYFLKVILSFNDDFMVDY